MEYYIVDAEKMALAFLLFIIAMACAAGVAVSWMLDDGD